MILADVALNSLIWWLIVGLIAGLLASAVMRGGIGYGIVGDIIAGLVGAFIGGWLFGVLGISIGGGLLASIIVAFGRLCWSLYLHCYLASFCAPLTVPVKRQTAASFRQVIGGEGNTLCCLRNLLWRNWPISSFFLR